jgi:hypothetical protein
MRQQSYWGVLWFFKRPQVSPMKNENKETDSMSSDASQQIPWQNRVAIVSFVITKIFNPCKRWTVMIQPSVLFMFSESV